MILPSSPPATSLALRRFLSFSTTVARASANSCAPPSSVTNVNTDGNIPNKKKKNTLVFMGSPQISALVLEKLLHAADSPSSDFEVAAVVTQPPARRERGRKLLPSPVAQLALDKGFPNDLIFTPERAGEEAFLSDMKVLNPGVCVTAAYGNILPTSFLKIPLHGTVNIHPSLLPLYRGAAPVQRALQDGVRETGVSLAFTVRALDAGPIIAQEKVMVDDYVTAPVLLEVLFDQGCKLLINELPAIFDGSAQLNAQAQDDSRATLAPKLTTQESWLSFEEEAFVLHNKVRAFAGWPGTKTKIKTFGGTTTNVIEIKIISTRFLNAFTAEGDKDEIVFKNDALLFPCSGQTALEVLVVQLPGKKAVNARDFWNGLQGQKLKTMPVEEASLLALC